MPCGPDRALRGPDRALLFERKRLTLFARPSHAPEAGGRIAAQPTKQCCAVGTPPSTGTEDFTAHAQRTSWPSESTMRRASEIARSGCTAWIDREGPHGISFGGSCEHGRPRDAFSREATRSGARGWKPPDRRGRDGVGRCALTVGAHCMTLRSRNLFFVRKDCRVVSDALTECAPRWFGRASWPRGLSGNYSGAGSAPCFCATSRRPRRPAALDC